MLGFVRSACLCGVFACLASFPTDGPARLRGLLVGPPRRAPRATAPACGDGRGSVVRVASQSSQQGSSALLRKVHAAHAHCTPSAGPRCPLTLAPPKLSVLLVAAAATSAAAKSATVAAPPAPPALPAPPVPPTLPTPRARKDAIIPAAAASAGTNWPAPRERPPTPSAPAACCGMCSAVCGVDVGMGCGEVGWAWGGKEGREAATVLDPVLCPSAQLCDGVGGESLRAAGPQPRRAREVAVLRSRAAHLLRARARTSVRARARTSVRARVGAQGRDRGSGFRFRLRARVLGQGRGSGLGKMAVLGV
jgi:hypothetical protein